MAGYDLATAIRRTRAGAVIRVVAYTGLAGAAWEQRARAAGIDLYLMKPVDAQILQRAIEGASPQERRPRGTRRRIA
jgi:CheY-like chemotaxis protein